MEELIALRKELHRYPEVSHKESNTALVIRDFIKKYNPDQVIENIGGSGIVFVFKGQEQGLNIAFRAELDALPIQEINEFKYKSVNEGVGHKCGHDGHMTMVAGLAEYLKNNRPKKGAVLLLFQPAEETGEGAELMFNDSKFSTLNIDYIFALHNLPGIPKGTIVSKNGVFASASKGLVVNLHGKTSHAAEPENGVSPAMAISEIIEAWNKLNDKELGLDDFAITTVVHAKLGSPSFGITPGEGVVMATLRAYKDEHLSILEDKAKLMAVQISEKYRLKYSFEEKEEFKSTINADDCHEHIAEAANALGFNYMEADNPFRWSEDFGVFTQNMKGAMFGLGAGESTPDLHNPDYDFPDDLIPIGVNMYKQIINQLLNK
ncbi:amidohydrolase [Fulvivirga lutea]|uniref:amidohydrolase n=1 Tax=Fulvivirga lutea TaxID=2810512 RepID=UPI001F43EA70|nr:amidohydrolase [Fulvivirga lutea]